MAPSLSGPRRRSDGADERARPYDPLGPESGPRGGDDGVSAGDVDEEELELKRQTNKTDLVHYSSFGCAILSCLCAGSITAYSVYGHLFLARLKYSQLQVNLVSIAAEISMYLPVPLWGYLCDRYSPGVASLLASLFFGLGYTLAAFTYHRGPPAEAGGDGWPFAVMLVAFVGVGAGTSCMYLSAVTTCAKNFGRGKHKGFALAAPIAAFGLSGMWQSQVGSQLLYERESDGRRGDVDVFKFFLFLAITLSAAGVVGFFGLQIVDAEELIDDAVDELERSGLLEESAFFHPRVTNGVYGSLDRRSSDGVSESLLLEREAPREWEGEEERKKTWLLNEKTRGFLKDHTMWWLAAGFLLVTGPGEAFINNLGTIIGTLYPPSTDATALPTTAATHVSIVAITSTVARLVTGTLSDLLAPSSTSHHHPARPTVSRMTFLLASGLLLSLGQVVLASGVIQEHGSRLWVVSSLIGAGYGAVFSLVPIICSVVWGVENFGTNWGILAMVPAVGATAWGLLYSAVYQAALGRHERVSEEAETACHGADCYAPTFWAMAGTVWLACGLWLWAWKGVGGWSRRGIPV